MTIEIRNLQSLMNVPERKLRAVLKHVMQEELGREVDLSIAVVNDKRIAELNQAFLNHVGPTDVLAFPFGEKATGVAGDVFGEIVISTQSAMREALQRKIDPELELMLYAVHGMLHLVGYDDQTDTGRKRMRRREAEILRSLSSSKGSKKKS